MEGWQSVGLVGDECFSGPPTLHDHGLPLTPAKAAGTERLTDRALSAARRAEKHDDGDHAIDAMTADGSREAPAGRPRDGSTARVRQLRCISVAAT